jgi:hypothetical protein
MAKVFPTPGLAPKKDLEFATFRARLGVPDLGEEEVGIRAAIAHYLMVWSQAVQRKVEPKDVDSRLTQEA